MKNIKKAEIKSSLLSDHSIPYIILKPMDVPKGPGFWKLNTSLLTNENYVKEVIEIIDTVKPLIFDNPQLKWDYLKMQVRGHTMRFATRLKKSEQNMIEVLQRKIDFFKNKAEFIANDSNLFELYSEQAILDRINEFENMKAEIVNKKLQGAIIRSRRNWLEKGEKNTRYFLSP